jgi:hypothetical protein
MSAHSKFSFVLSVQSAVNSLTFYTLLQRYSVEALKRLPFVSEQVLL